MDAQAIIAATTIAAITAVVNPAIIAPNPAKQSKV